MDDDEEEVEDPRAEMAEFDLVLDKSSTIPSGDEPLNMEFFQRCTSSMHAISELYRCANRVYQLYEERKKLVAGLRAGMA